MHAWFRHTTRSSNVLSSLRTHAPNNLAECPVDVACSGCQPGTDGYTCDDYGELNGGIRLAKFQCRSGNERGRKPGLELVGNIREAKVGALSVVFLKVLTLRGVGPFDKLFFSSS